MSGFSADPHFWCGSVVLHLFLNLKVIKDYLEWDDDFLKALSVLCLSALVDESENAVLETGRSK